MKGKTPLRIGAERYELLAQLAHDGLCAAQISQALGVTPAAVREHARRHGIKLRPQVQSASHDQRAKGRIGKHRYAEVDRMIREGRTASEIADALGVFHETVRKYARKRGLLLQVQCMKAELHPMWKGGTTTDRSGYLLRRVDKDGQYGYLIRAIAKRGHAGTDSTGYAPVHRIVMHDKLGRPLQPGEVVDHIDGDRTNNDPQNLRVFASNSDHLRETLAGRRPAWTEEGYDRMCAPRGRRQRKGSQPAPIECPSRTDDQA